MVLWRRLLLHQLLQPFHPLTDHVRQFPRRLCFPAILRHVRGGKDYEDLADGIRVVAVVVSVLGHNCVMCNTDFCPPFLMCRQLCVGEDND